MLSGRYRSRTLLKVAWNIQPWLHLRMGTFGSASFHKAKKFWYSFRAPAVSRSGTYWIPGVSRKIFRLAHWHTCSSHGHWLGFAGRVTKSASTSPCLVQEDGSSRCGRRKKNPTMIPASSNPAGTTIFECGEKCSYLVTGAVSAGLVGGLSRI
jgi:hypothetical protein